MSSIPASRLDQTAREVEEQQLHARVGEGMLYLLNHYDGYSTGNPEVARLMVEKIHRCGWDPFMYARSHHGWTDFEYPPIAGWEVRYVYR